MKPRTKFEKAVAASNERLTAISSKVIAWAIKKVVPHIAFRTSEHKCTCGDCGMKFDYKGKDKSVSCPHCGSRLQVNDTLKRKMTETTYFSSLEVVDGLQVQRVFLLKVAYRKGEAMKMNYWEVCRMWLNSEGKLAVTARARTLGHYMDSFNWSSQIDLKRLYDVYWVISDTYAYPRYRVLPELRRNGMKGKLPDCHPTRLMNALLADSRIETMMKSRDLQAVGYFVHHLSDLDRCWHSYKIAARNHYQPSDYGIWCDTIRLLEQCGKDIHNTKYKRAGELVLKEIPQNCNLLTKSVGRNLKGTAIAAIVSDELTDAATQMAALYPFMKQLVTSRSYDVAGGDGNKEKHKVNLLSSAERYYIANEVVTRLEAINTDLFILAWQVRTLSWNDLWFSLDPEGWANVMSGKNIITGIVNDWNRGFRY